MEGSLTTEDFLIKDIIDSPEDDGLRLIYADWLEDNGHEVRAELVRLQIEIYKEERDCDCGRRGGNHKFAGGQHHNGPCAGDQLRIQVEGRWVRARKREFELLDTPEVSKHFRNIVSDKTVSWSWRTRRGLAYLVEIPMVDWLKFGKGFCSCNPIEEVRILGVAPLDNLIWGRDDVKVKGDAVAQGDGLGEITDMPASPSRLPREIWDCLEGFEALRVGWQVVDGPNLKQYRSGRDVCMKALSDACLLFARK